MDIPIIPVKPPILIAEDSEVDAILIEATLKEFYTLTIVGTGADALDKLKQNHYDLLITDLEMPVKGGIEVVVVTEALYPNLPIIVVSNHSWEYYNYRGKYPNVKHWIDKPFKPSMMVGLVAGTISNFNHDIN